MTTTRAHHSSVRICASVAMTVLACAFITGCGPTKEGMKNRQAASDRMNLIGAQVNYEQAKQLFATGQLDKSLREIEKAIARFDNSGEFYLMRGRILVEQGRLEQALESFATAIEKKPDLADAQYYSGVVYQRWSDDEQAYVCYQAAFDLSPQKVHYLMAAVEALVAMGEFDRAEQLIVPKLAYFEHNAGLRQLQAQIAMLQGDAARSAELYAEARLLNPDDETLLEEMMWVQYDAGMYSKCVDSAKVLELKLETPRTDITHLQARCLAMMGRTVEARELYVKLSRSRSSDPAVWSELGSLAWELGDYRNLALASVQLMSIAPERYEGYLFRAINERQKGNAAETLRLLRESCQRASGVALPHLMLGQSLEQAGDSGGARTAYNEALEAEPTSEQAKAYLRRLNEEQHLTAVPEQ